MLFEPKILNLALQVTLALIMFSVGLSLRKEELLLINKNRSMVLFGVVVKLIIFPALALLGILYLPLSAIHKYGIIILLLCPGGTTSNVITYWTKGNSALTILLTTSASVFVFLTLPFLANLAAKILLSKSTLVFLPVWSTGRDILLIILLPAAIGMYLRDRASAVALRMEIIIARVSLVMLALVYLLKFFTPSAEGGVTIISYAVVAQLLPVLLILNVGGMVLTFLFTKSFFTVRNARTIGLEMGVQNVPLAILVGDVYLALPGVSQPALLYAMFTFWTTLGFAYWARRGELDT